MLSTGWMQLVLLIMSLRQIPNQQFQLENKNTVYKQCWPKWFPFRKYFLEKLYKKDYNFVPFCFLIKSNNLKKQFEISSFPTVFSSIIPLKKLPCSFPFHESRYLRQKMYQLPHQSENNLIKTRFLRFNF